MAKKRDFRSKLETSGKIPPLAKNFSKIPPPGNFGHSRCLVCCEKSTINLRFPQFPLLNF